MVLLNGIFSKHFMTLKFLVNINSLLKSSTSSAIQLHVILLRTSSLKNLSLFCVTTTSSIFSSLVLLFPPTSQTLEFLKDWSIVFSSLFYTNFFTEFYLLRVFAVTLMMKSITSTSVLCIFNLYSTSLFPNMELLEPL